MRDQARTPSSEGHAAPHGKADLRAPTSGEGLAPASAKTTARLPLIPPLSESSDIARLTIGYASDNDVLLSGRSPFPGTNPTCGTICHTAEGWILIDGTFHPDGTVTPGPSDILLNGRRVEGYANLEQDDVIQVAGNSFIFVDPLESAKRAAPAWPPLELGESWLRRTESDGHVLALASFRGLIDKYDENQDRAFFRVFPEGVFAGVADGMGGHDSGERSAEVGRGAFYESVDSHADLEEAIEDMNAAIVESNRAHHERGGAVFAGVHLGADGRIEARTVGDCEVVVMSLPVVRSSGSCHDLRLDFWSTRPNHAQERTYPLKRLADGRVARGYERTLRLDPDSNVVDWALGLHKGSSRRYQTVDWIETEPERVYFCLCMSDGLSEQYLTHDEMLEVVADHVRRTDDISPEGVRDALMRDALIRCGLARRAYREAKPFAVTRPVFREVYREMIFEMEGCDRDPPGDLPAWTYQSRTEADGRKIHFFMVPAGGAAYLVRGVGLPGRGYVADPDVVGEITGRLLIDNPAETDHPSIVGRFKQDNISVAVLAFVRSGEGFRPKSP